MASGVPGCSRRARKLGSCQFRAKRIRDPGDNVHLQFAELGAVALEAVGPNMCAGVGRDKLGVLDGYVEFTRQRPEWPSRRRRGPAPHQASV